MRKSIILKVKLKVEGDAAPAADFEQLALQAVRDILAAGSAQQPLLKVTLKESRESSNDDDEAGSTNAKEAGSTAASEAGKAADGNAQATPGK